ncbi:RrF2 family transcriptional regulator [Athalassotoga saccharophila]|uniref:RrF2 family transcriptional regulator n=1 Tax=Athalassotoga saccharophila TaxID=1441386 RepID=UPI00137A441D|nr:Rrf2 family transcriptional regulator [Athalassotoga saccharophila]BBJ28852.1 HTH-type transcriptional regulator CymR [Athalassotoga saccharophila]
MLDLSTKSSYATRAVYELARAWNKGLEKLTLKEIVSKQDVPTDYMEKLLFQLKKAGIVVTIRGKNGGYALAKKPSEIRISDIITLMENPTKRLNCLERDKGKQRCDMFDYCMIKYVWNDAYMAMTKALSKYTFQDLIDMENKYSARS